MFDDVRANPSFEWLDHVRREGLVVARCVLADLGVEPIEQNRLDSAEAADHVGLDREAPALSDPWAFVRQVLNWPAQHVAGAPEGPALPETAIVALPGLETTLEAQWAVLDSTDSARIELLVRLEVAGIDPDQRGALPGWEATAQQRFERLLRESGVESGVLISDKELRLVHAPRGETAGWIGWPLHELTSVAGRSMLGGLKLMLDDNRLFREQESHRLPAILKASRAAQAGVSIELSGQVLGPSTSFCEASRTTMKDGGSSRSWRVRRRTSSTRGCSRS